MQIILLLLAFVAPDNFSDVTISDKIYTNVYHYRSNITLSNSDGTNSSIYVNGNSATLFNSDGTQSTIDFNAKTIVAIDGTISTFSHNRFSSTVFNTDGSQVMVNHQQSTSSCFTEYGKHTVTHTFGDVKEMRHKNKIDLLIYTNWLIKEKAKKAELKLEKQEQQK